MNAVEPSPASAVAVPELLAPAGDWDAMRAAVANGADAVYFGLRGGNFNARYRATNFSVDELPEVMRYLHGHNVRGYIAFNTLIFSDELPDAVATMKAIASAKVDAVIVQDLGLAALIRRLCPGLHVHGSTQMTLTEPLGIEFVRGLGVRRVILARELSAVDIQRITAVTDMPVEVFIHGALCVSYSGQCLTSESLGGRSANRGQCAQACRLPYDLVVDGELRDLGDKAYLLSPQDLAAYDLVNDLAKIGVCSFKIEGRLKSPHYVAATTQTYRAAIDASVAQQPFALPRERELELAQSFSRGFTHGFFDGVDHQELVHARFPKSRGVRVGEVVGRTARGVLIEIGTNTKHDGFVAGGTLAIGDGVVFDEGHPEQDEQGGRVASVTPFTGGRRDPRTLEVCFDRGAVNLDAVPVGAIVWKTDDPAVRRRLETTFARDTVVRRVPVSAAVSARVGELLTVTVRDAVGREATVSWDKPLEAAQKFPLTETLFREQFGRMGDTPFELGRVEGLETPSGAMAPKSVLNDLRRQAVERLVELRSEADRFAIADPEALENERARISVAWAPRPCDSKKDQTHGRGAHATMEPHLHVLARTLDQVRGVLDWHAAATAAGDAGVSTVYCDFEDVRKYKEVVPLAKAVGVPVGLATVRIIKPNEDGLLRMLADCGPDLVLVRNLAGLSFFARHAPELPLVADYSLNVANELTAALLAERGVLRMVPSYDLNWTQLGAMMNRFPARHFEAVVHQHMPMFHMEHCVAAHLLSSGKDYRDCGRPCERHEVDVRDRVGQSHPVIMDVGCRNTVYNGQAQSAAEYIPKMRDMGIVHFRVELLRQREHEVATVLRQYADLLAGRTQPRAAVRSLSVLTQLGVTRGTLDHE